MNQYQSVRLTTMEEGGQRAGRCCSWKFLYKAIRDEWKMIVACISIIGLLIVTSAELTKKKSNNTIYIKENYTKMLTDKEIQDLYNSYENNRGFVLFVNDKLNESVQSNTTIEQNKSPVIKRISRIIHNETSPKEISLDIPHLTSTGYETSTKIIAALTYFRNKPIIVLVKDDPEIYKIALRFMNILITNINIRNEFWFLAFNETGIIGSIINSTKSKYYFLSEIKKKSKGNPYKSSAYVGPKITKNPATFFAILKSVQILSQKSAILLFTDDQPNDESLAQITLGLMRRMHVQLFIVWAGSDADADDAGSVLREVANTSGGALFLGNSERNMSALNGLQHLHSWESRESKQLLLVQQNLKDVVNFELPIDGTISKVHFTFSSRLTTAELTSEKAGFKINLLDFRAVEIFSPGSFIAHDPGKSIDVQLNIAQLTATPNVGSWRLTTTGMAGYNVTVFAITNISIMREYPPKNNTANTKYLSITENRTINFKLKGDIARIDNISIVDSSGRETHLQSNLSYNCVATYKLTTADFAQSNKNLVLDVTKLPSDKFYLKINGTNHQGDHFSRISYVDSQVIVNDLPSVTIETNVRSNLIIGPGKGTDIIFDITNNKDQMVYMYFTCRDDKSLLQHLQPQHAWFAPKQTISVRVSIFSWAPLRSDVSDLLTFKADGEYAAEKSALLYVVNERKLDSDQPDLDYKFTSSCNEIPRSKCYTATWTIEVTAQDTGSGLLQLSSDPPGLRPKYNYISGTKEPVTAFYTSSCCQPYLKIFATDLQHNSQFYRTDAYHANLSIGSISAIILGALLFLSFMGCVIFWIRKKRSRNARTTLSVYHRSMSDTVL